MPFNDLDSPSDSQCIYFTQKGLRCRNSCSQSDKMQAIALRKTVSAILSETNSLELLRNYILLKCCRAARHRSRIVDAELLVPLALRWQDEIYKHSHRTTPIHFMASSPTHEARLTPGPGFMTNLNTPAANSLSLQLNIDSSFINIASSAENVAVPLCSTSTRSPTADAFEYEPIQMQTRHKLRSREVNVPVKFNPITHAGSEFRPHKPNSSRADSVFSKMQANLRNRDLETGSIYIFDRASSPGHVKIGWTSVSVAGRLQKWSECGYTPNLILSVDRIPHAQRVETLVHHELIKQWRRERSCKGIGCGKQHQEWFETSKERAMHVLRSWADFMREAQPYDLLGELKDPIRAIIQSMDTRGELLTGQKVLERFHASLSTRLTPVTPVPQTNNPAQLRHQSKLLKEAPASKPEAQLKTDRTFGEPSPSQVAVVKHITPYEQIVLPHSGPVLPRTSPQETELKRDLKTLEKAVQDLINRLCTEVPAGRVPSSVRSVGETLRYETPRSVTLTA